MLEQLIYILLSCAGGVIGVELGGYVWHRWAEHGGKLGQKVVSRHIKHHEKDYPYTKLRPHKNKYQSAKSWSWYILGTILIILMYILVARPYSFIMIASGLIYAKFVVNYLHSRFHINNHWLAKNHRFQKIQKLHDIHHWGPYNYGILFYFLDRLFGTYNDNFPNKKLNNFNSNKQ